MTRELFGDPTVTRDMTNLVLERDGGLGGVRWMVPEVRACPLLYESFLRPSTSHYSPSLPRDDLIHLP